jgi:uncharacterized protein YjbJ (UPF0337 family)
MDDKVRRTPAEVAAESSIEHTGKGVFNQMKGTLKEAWGKVTDNPKIKFEGKMDRMKGRVQEKLGDLEARESRLEAGGEFDDTEPFPRR